MARGPSTRAVHDGEETDAPPGRHPAATPVVHTAPWVFSDSGALEAAFDALPGDRRGLYSRYENPTVRALERKVAALEGADDAVAFASGMAAISTTLTALLAPGDRLLAAADLYGGTDGWLKRLAARQPELTVERAPLGELAERLERDDDATDLAAVYLETPSNPLLACCDLAALAQRCRHLGEGRGRPVWLLVDGTMASPAVQRPLLCGSGGRGADLVLHSATKFLAGHSDVTAGVVAGDAALVERIRGEAIAAGPCLDPHAAFLVSRGIRTLGLRLRRGSDNAARLARLLAGHPVVTRVHYPGRVEAGGFDPVAAGQMADGGPMLAFELAGGLEAARTLVDGLELVRLIPSLGGVESGAVLPAITSHRSLSAGERRRRGIADGLIRMSCGIEDGDDLEVDLRCALDGLAQGGAA